MKHKILLSEGPGAYRVYQRKQNDTAALPIKGYATPQIDGTLSVSAYDEDSTSLVSQKVLTCDKGFFEGEMNDIPVGQYIVKLELLNHENKVICSQEIKHIAVGDLYLLAGQSNMDGVGKLINMEKPLKNVRCFYFNDKWDIARDPLCWYLIITECKVDRNKKNHILLKFKEPVPEKSYLWYGKGIINTVCNLKDALGLAAPVFGPIEI